jgi:mono/diheme cytochrome c family protein
MQKSFGKRVLKWLGISFLSIFLLVALIYTVVYLSTQNRIDKIYNVTVQDLTIPSDSLSYEKGRHIAQNRGCMGCHGENLAGKEVFLPPGSPMGTLVASNITSGKGGIQYNDKDWIRILRHGVNKEGKSVWFMPSHEFCHLSNSDMSALISYVKNQHPVNNTVPKKEIKPLGRLMVFLNKFPLLPAEFINHSEKYADDIPPAITPEYGAYLATACQGCHAKTYTGSPPLGPGGPAIPNISHTGDVGKWKEQEFITVMRTGKRPDGRQLSDAMPYKYFTFKDDELKAIYAFLHQEK